MYFRTASAALRYYYRNLYRIEGLHSLPLEPREVEGGRKRDGLDELHMTLLDIAAGMKGLRRLERDVLELVYREELSFQGVRETLAHRFRRGVVWIGRDGSRRRVRTYPDRFLIRVRRGAEEHVEKRLERRGLLG